MLFTPQYLNAKKMVDLLRREGADQAALNEYGGLFTAPLWKVHKAIKRFDELPPSNRKERMRPAIDYLHACRYKSSEDIAKLLEAVEEGTLSREVL